MVKILATVAVSGILAGPARHVKPEATYRVLPCVSLRAALTTVIGASTQQASDMVGEAVFEIIESYLNTGQVLNCVNLSKKSKADHLTSTSC